MATVNGVCDSRFKLLHDAMEANLASGDELGASIAIDLDGETVVDLWGGWRDEGKHQPWDRDTIVNVWSTTKTVTSLAMLMLVARGDLDVYAPVARYWPEFAAAGKEAVEVRHLLSHTSGRFGPGPAGRRRGPLRLGGVDLAPGRRRRRGGSRAPLPVTTPSTSDICSVRYSVGSPAPPEAVRGRGDRRSARCRLPDRRRDRGQRPHRAVVAPPPLPFDLDAMDPASPAVRTFTGPPLDAAVANSAGWRAADIGGANGHGNARSVARMLSAVTLGGQVGDRRLLSPEAIELIFDEQADGIDVVLGVPLRFGIGYALPKARAHSLRPTGRVCFWGGWGGSVILMDLDRRMTFAYMMNKMAPGIIGSDRAETYVRTAYAALDVPLPPAEE